MLEVDDLSVDLGRKHILSGVTLKAAPNAITALVGHNGAGKTTLLRAVMGLARLRSGSIKVFGESMINRSPGAIARRGVAFVPQGRHVFRDLTVEENLLIGRSARIVDSDLNIGFDDVFGMFPALRERRGQRVHLMSGGQQQMVALAMALLRNPRLMMLDEPSTGLAPVLVDQVFETVQRIRDVFGVGLLIVDQNVDRLIQLADHTFVLKAGRIVGDGAAQDFRDLRVLWSLF